jgi:hypothetical protein
VGHKWVCGLGRLCFAGMMAVLVSRAGRIATLTLLVSVIALLAYQFPAETSFARLRSWYPLATAAETPGPAPSEVCVSPICFFLLSSVYISKSKSRFLRFYSSELCDLRLVDVEDLWRVVVLVTASSPLLTGPV